MELDIPYDEPAPTRKRGDFRRRGDQGPPVVVSLTKTRKRKGLKADLQALADAAGIDHTGMTVPQLHDALGPEPGDDVYGRPSGYGDAIEPMWNLMKHHEREIVFGFLVHYATHADDSFYGAYVQAGRPEFYDAVSDNPDARRILDRIAARCGDLAGRHNAADRGTWIHALTEWAEDHRACPTPCDDDCDAICHEGHLVPHRRDHEPPDDPEPRFGVDPALTADIARGWLQLLDDNGLEVIACEAKVVNDDLRLAGTLDRLVRLTKPLTFGGVTIAAGSVVVLDIKSSKLRDNGDGLPTYWASYPIQIYAYATGVPYHIDEHWEDD